MEAFFPHVGHGNTRNNWGHTTSFEHTSQFCRSSWDGRRTTLEFQQSVLKGGQSNAATMACVAETDPRMMKRMQQQYGR